MDVTAYKLAKRFLGLSEVAGAAHNPHILTMLQLDNPGIQGDETPWCSAFVNYICWLLNIPRSQSLAARSWLMVGQSVTLAEAQADPENCIVVLKRGTPHGPEVTSGAPGHVGFFDRVVGDRIVILGGNQGNKVSMARYPLSDLLDIRRLV